MTPLDASTQYAHRKHMICVGYRWQGRGRIFSPCNYCGETVRISTILGHIHQAHPETIFAQMLERLRPGGLAQ